MKILAYFFVFVWVAGTGAVDYLICRDLLRQIHTAGFVATTGEVSSSKVVPVPVNYEEPEIHYTYTVAGTKYTGDKYRATDNSDRAQAPSAEAREAVRLHPVGSQATVYYDPAQPADSVLIHGIEGSSLAVLLFLTPFNLLAIVFASAPVLALFGTKNPGSLKWRVEGMKSRVRLAKLGGPVFHGLCFLGLGSMVCGGIMLGSRPSLAVALTAWAAALGLGLGAAGWRWRKLAGGASDLVLDPGAGTLELPAGEKGGPRRSLPLTEVQSVEVNREDARDRRGNKMSDAWGNAVQKHVVMLKRKNGESEEVFDWPGGSRAQALLFAATLREKLNLAPVDEAAW